MQANGPLGYKLEAHDDVHKLQQELAQLRDQNAARDAATQALIADRDAWKAKAERLEQLRVEAATVAAGLYSQLTASYITGS